MLCPYLFDFPHEFVDFAHFESALSHKESVDHEVMLPLGLLLPVGLSDHEEAFIVHEVKHFAWDAHRLVLEGVRLDTFFDVRDWSEATGV